MREKELAAPVGTPDTEVLDQAYPSYRLRVFQAADPSPLRLLRADSNLQLLGKHCRIAYSVSGRFERISNARGRAARLLSALLSTPSCDLPHSMACTGTPRVSYSPQAAAVAMDTSKRCATRRLQEWSLQCTDVCGRFTVSLPGVVRAALCGCGWVAR